MEPSEKQFEIKDVVLDYETFKKYNDVTCKRLKKPLDLSKIKKHILIEFIKDRTPSKYITITLP